MNPKFWEKVKVKSDTSTMDKIVMCLAEFFGSWIVLCVGCAGTQFGSGLSSSLGGALPGVAGAVGRVVTGVAAIPSGLSFGLSYMIVAQIFGHISGGHANPTVSLAAMLSGVISVVDFLIFLLGQILGAIVGTLIIDALFDDAYQAHACAFDLDLAVKSKSTTETAALFVEVVFSLFLAMVVCAIWDERNKEKKDSTPLRLGLAYLVLIAGAAQCTGGYLNLLRITPNIVSKLQDKLTVSGVNTVWIPLIGSLLGSFLGAICYSILFSDEKGKAPEE